MVCRHVGRALSCDANRGLEPEPSCLLLHALWQRQRFEKPSSISQRQLRKRRDVSSAQPARLEHKRTIVDKRPRVSPSPPRQRQHTTARAHHHLAACEHDRQHGLDDSLGERLSRRPQTRPCQEGDRHRLQWPSRDYYSARWLGQPRDPPKLGSAVSSRTSPLFG